MTLYAPKYYKDFHCIADKCTHSCCIGWEIDIDPDTLEKYKALSDGYGLVVKNSISYEGDPHFKLGCGDRCPHLNEKGLCNIILGIGEDHLCNICREHPRFYNFTSVAELGIGMSCIESARVILSADEYDTFYEIGEVDCSDSFDFDGRADRSAIYKILKDKDLSYGEKLDNISSKYGAMPLYDETYLEIINSLEYLDSSHKELFLKYSSSARPLDAEKCLERALAYFIYRHCTEAFDVEDFAVRLTFCLFLERLLASLICTENAKTLDEIATLTSIISEEIEYNDENTEALTY